MDDYRIKIKQGVDCLLTGCCCCCCVSTADDLDLRGVIPTFSPFIIDSTTANKKQVIYVTMHTVWPK